MGGAAVRSELILNIGDTDMATVAVLVQHEGAILKYLRFDDIAMADEEGSWAATKWWKNGMSALSGVSASDPSSDGVDGDGVDRVTDSDSDSSSSADGGFDGT